MTGFVLQGHIYLVSTPTSDAENEIWISAVLKIFEISETLRILLLSFHYYIILYTVDSLLYPETHACQQYGTYTLQFQDELLWIMDMVLEL